VNNTSLRLRWPLVALPASIAVTAIAASTLGARFAPWTPS
jgi:hypothetical protein